MRRRPKNLPEYLWGVPDTASKKPRNTSGYVPGVKGGSKGTVHQAGTPAPVTDTNTPGIQAPSTAPIPGTPSPATRRRGERRREASSDYSTPSDSYLPAELLDLITPGPTAKEIAESAVRLGVKPKDSSGGLLDQVGDTVDAISEDFSKGVKAVTQETQKLAKLPSQRVDNVLGNKTLGTPTIGQIAGAAVRGQIRVNRKGKLTVPKTRQAARGLAQARSRLAHAGRHDVGGVPDPELRQAIIKYAPLVDAYAEKHYGISGEALLSKDLQGESNFSGDAKSSAGAASYAQFIPSTRDDFLQRYGVDAYGSKDEAVKAMAMYLGGKTAYTPGLEGYNPGPPGSGGGAEYVDYILSQPAGTPVGRPDPKARAAFLGAKAKAQKLGIPTKAGDVEPGPQPKTVFVRADAKGFVDWAKALLGTQEGSRLQVKWAAEAGLSPAEAWCSEFIAAGIRRRGLTPPPGYPMSDAWTNWDQGTDIGADLSKAKPGDILVIGGNQHVGLYVGGGMMIAGNWSDEVAEYPVSDDSRGVTNIVRPHFKGGKVAVKESTVLPGAALGPGGAIISGPAGTAAEGTAIGGGGAPVQQAAPVPTRSVETSPLLATGAALPAAYQQFQQGLTPEAPEGGELGGLIAAILRRGRV